MIVEITSKEQFDTALSDTDKLVLVDFRAERCGPCKMLKPVLHDFAEKRDDIVLLTVDVDAAWNGDLTMQYGVRSIPQVNFFKSGEEIDKFVWALPPDQVEVLIDKHVGASNEGSTDEQSEQQEESEQEQE